MLVRWRYHPPLTAWQRLVIAQVSGFAAGFAPQGGQAAGPAAQAPVLKTPSS